MRSELVVSHHTCNQRCGHCTERRSGDDRAWVQTRAVLGRVRAPDEAAPPCDFPRPTSVAHLYAMTAGLSARPDQKYFEACDLRSRGYGVRRGYLALYGAEELRPLRGSA